VTEAPPDGRWARLQARARNRWRRLRQRRPALDHVVAAWQLQQRNNATLYAAAITYFSFLALFPLLLLAVSVVAFALHSDPALQHSLYERVAQRFPGRVGTTVHDAIQTAIDNRSSVGVVGLVGLLLTGLGWIANLRAAIDAVWGRGQRKVGFLQARLGNLLVLVGLGLGSAVSLGLTAVGTSLTDQLLRAVGLEHLPGAAWLLKLLGIALALAGDTLIFWWLLVRLPAVEVPGRIAWRGALLAAAGFEVLKIVGTYIIAHTASSPTAGPFAGLVAVLIWMQLVARFLLFSCAWTATLTAEARIAAANQAPVDEPAVMADATRPAGRDSSAVSPAAVGAGLVGAGAVVGAAATLAATRPHHRRLRARSRP